MAEPQEIIDKKIADINAEIRSKNEEAEKLLEYLNVKRKAARELEEKEEQELKLRGIIIGQHIPSIKSKLKIDSSALSDFSSFSSSLLVAKDLIEQNKTNFLRRTGNLPISDVAYSKQLQHSKFQSEFVPDAPHYLLKTNNTNARETRVAVRFSETLESYKMDRTNKKFESTALVSTELKKSKKAATKLSAEQRVENENILKGINHKLNYLRNPRNDPRSVTKMLIKSEADFVGAFEKNDAFGMPEGSSLSSNQNADSIDYQESGVTTDTSHTQSSPTSKTKRSYKKNYILKDNPLFVCEPSEAHFTNYDIGEKYTQTLTFRNVSAVSRSVRVLQPTNSVFSITPLRFPANCNGSMVAPGMYVSTTLKFCPQSLGDYSDAIRVETESGSSILNIIAQREPPQLSIPSLLDIGACFIGDANHVVFKCTNTGGAGKFNLQLSDASDAQRTEACLRLPPFTVYPTDFTLYRNDSVDINIEFIPLSIGSFERSFEVLCDNGQVRKFSIKGVGREITVTQVEVNAVELDTADPKIFGDMYFASTDIGSERTQHVQIVNDSGLPVEYEWVFVEPHVKDLHKAGQRKILLRQKADEERLNGEIRDDYENNEEFAQKSFINTINGTGTFTNSVAEGGFTLTPARGVLPSEGTERFSITFSPPQISAVSTRAVLVIKSVPYPAMPGPEQKSYIKKLAEQGHGKYYRLRSWLEEIGSEGQVEEYIHLNGMPCFTKQLVNLRTIINLVIKQTSGKYSEGWEDIALAQEYARLNNWIRAIIHHVFHIRKNAAIADDAPSSDDEDQNNNNGGDGDSVAIQVYDCVDLADNVPKLLLPATVSYSNCKVLAGSTSKDIVKLLLHFNALDDSLLSETWLDSQNCLALLGDNICQVLDNQVNHEAIEYLKECALTNLACLNFRVFGEGKPRVVKISPPVLDIGGHLSIGREWSGSFTLTNLGEAMSEIQIDSKNISIVTELCSKQLGEYTDALQIAPDDDEAIKDFAISFSSERILLMPKRNELVEVSCKVQRLGKYDIIIPFKSESKAVRIDSLRLSVRTSGPRLRFDVAEMDLGLIGVGGETVQLLSFTNEGDVPVFFMMKPSLFVDVAAAPRKQSDKGSARKDSHKDSHKDGHSHSHSHRDGHKDSINSHRDSIGNLSSRSKQSTGRSDDFSVQDSTASSGGDFKIELKYAVVSIEPSSGIVKPQEQLTVQVKCSAGKTPQRIRGMLECRLFNEDSRFELCSHYLNLRGEVQAPKTIMYPMKINLGQVYVGQPVKFSVTIENLCNLPTKYKLLRPGGESSLYRISFDKAKGDLAAKATVDIECTFTALLTGFIDDVLSNKIFGTMVPLGFEVIAQAKGVLLEFMNLNDNELPPEPLALPTDAQFPGGKKAPEPKPIEPLVLGSSVPLYERRVRRFAIRNFSAIPAKFELRPRKYVIAEKVKKLGERSVSSLQSSVSFLSLERKDAIIAPHEGGANNFYSEAGKKYISAADERQEDRKFLYSGLGASYFLEVCEGTVPPWGVQVLTIRAFNDIPGNYDDELECILHEGEVDRVFLLPLKLDVTGCPIIIEKDVLGMTEVRKGHEGPADMIGKQLVKLGYSTVNSAPLVREFYLKNNGSKRGRVRWDIRSISSKANGPIKFTIKVNNVGPKVKSSFQFWDDLAKDSPFLVEPTKSTIKPYGRQKYTLTLTKTDTLGREIAKLTGSVTFSEDVASTSSIDEATSFLSGSASTARPGTGSTRPGTTGVKFALELFVEGEFLHPTVTVGDFKLVASLLDTINYVPESQAVVLESQAPLLFSPAGGQKLSDICVKPITILNPSPAALSFTVSVEGPYCLKDSPATSGLQRQSTNGNQPSSVLSTGKSFHLFPNESGSLVVAFNPKKNMRESLIESLSREAGQSLEQKGALVFTYSTGQILHLPLITRIGTPFLIGSSPRVHFGVCHVTKPCEGILMLSNPTNVPATWTVAHVPGGGAWKKSTAIRVKGFADKAVELDDPNVFEITPNAGSVAGPTVSISAAVAAPPKDFNRKADSIVQQKLVQASWATNTLTLKDSLDLRHNKGTDKSEAAACYPLPLTIRFSPTKNSLYSCRFRFTCEYGNEFDVVLQGEGTYEEHLHKPVIPIPK